MAGSNRACWHHGRRGQELRGEAGADAEHEDRLPAQEPELDKGKRPSAEVRGRAR